MSNNAMELGIESVKVSNNTNSPNQQQMYRPMKKKFPRTYINILHDPRVVRGNTYAAFVIPSSLQKEFMFLKEQEERRKKLLKFPKKLPRVAFLSKKMKEDNDENKDQLEEKPKTPKLQELEDPEFIEDYPYFYIDKPPSPKYVPLPPGREIECQVEDGELFDYELEVKPILEVLVGRSLIQARMELIQENERSVYLKHKKNYEQLREFELINLQRQEAARIRREEEKNRRENQKEERRKINIITQKKLVATLFAKRTIVPLKNNCFNHLLETGVMRKPEEFNHIKFLDRSLINVSENLNDRNNQIESILKNEMMSVVKNVLSDKHKKVIQNFNDKVKQDLEDEERRIKQEEEDKRQRLIEKEKERENRRNDRIRIRIEETNIQTKNFKQDMLNINLADIDEFSLKNEHGINILIKVHTFGGYLGEVLVIFNEMFEKHFSQMTEFDIMANAESMLAKILMAFDIRVLELKYFETIKIDMTTSIDKVTDPAMLDAYKGIYYDNRRIASKSIKFMLDNNLIDEKVYSLFLDTIFRLLLKKPVDLETVDKNWQASGLEPDFDKINSEKEEIRQNNEQLVKLKGKVRFTYVKVDDYKKKRNKMAAIINVSPSDIMEAYKEEEEPHLKTDPSNTHADHSKDHHADHSKDKVPAADVHVEENHIKYPNTALVFQNTILPYDFYLIHEGATDLIRLKILSEYKNLLGKENFNLNENYLLVQNKFKIIKQKLVENIKANEKFFEKEIKGFKDIFDISVTSVEKPPETV